MDIRPAAAGCAIAVAMVWAGVPVTARADETRDCKPWFGYSICYQTSDATWWMCNPDCGRVPPPMLPFPGLPPELPPGAPPPPPPKPAPPPPPWPWQWFPGCWILDGCYS